MGIQNLVQIPCIQRMLSSLGFLTHHLVVSSHLKNRCQSGNLPQFSGWVLKNSIWKPPPSHFYLVLPWSLSLKKIPYQSQHGLNSVVRVVFREPRNLFFIPPNQPKTRWKQNTPENGVFSVFFVLVFVWFHVSIFFVAQFDMFCNFWAPTFLLFC